MISPVRAPAMFAASSSSTGAILVATDGRVLPLRSTTIDVHAGGGLARVVLTQQFTNPHAEPLHVTYQVPLPADGAVSGYKFRIGEREVVGQIDRKDDARQRFVEAVMEGRTAALLEQDRSALFTQELGNIPPGTSIDVELQIDQPLTWIAEREGTWEWRFPTVVAPRYMGAPGRVTDAARLTTHTTFDRLPVAVALAIAIDDPQRGIECPSHAVQTAASGRATRVTLAEAGATLDRDVVVRWQVAGEHATTVAHRARPNDADDAFALLTIVPPRASATPTPLARDLIVLLDTSGSMSGAPLDQSQRLACALIDQLGDHDRLELIEFSTSTRAWQRNPVLATTAHRTAAKQWVRQLSARGGTEMRIGIRAALASLRPEAQRQVILVTDGQIGFESEIVAEIHGALPAGCRVHTVGVGSAVNRSLTSPAARAGRGIEIVVGIDEDPERAIARLCAHTRAPLVVDLSLEGDALREYAPMHLPDLMADHPATIAVRVSPRGGTIVVRGRTATGAWEQRLQLPPTAVAEGNPAVATRFGRERVEDLELRIAAGEQNLDNTIEQIGLAFGITTRLTSWIAIDRVGSIDTTAPTRHEIMPQALPHGMSASGVGLRPTMQGGLGGAQRYEGSAVDGAVMAAPAKRKGFVAGIVGSLRRASSPAPQAPTGAPPSPAAPPPPSARGRAAPPRIAAHSPSDEEERDAAPEEAATFLSEESSRTQAGAIHGTLLEVTGRFVQLQDGTLVIEFTATAALDWTIPATIELHFDDGATITTAIDATRSTREGPLDAGVQVRIVCPNARAGDVILAIAAYTLLLVVRR